MAALTKDNVLTLWGLLAKKPEAIRESRKAREFANSVYKQMGGPTPKMKRFYADLLDNERRSRAGS